MNARTEVELGTVLVEAGNHLLGSITGTRTGPTLIVLGGIHGNEPAGAIASRQVLEELRGFESRLSGEVVFVAGNTRALLRRTRYVDADLNRHWSPIKMETALSMTNRAGTCSEDVELAELYAVFSEVVDRSTGPVYFLDLHTSSADGVPFATVGDTLRNRRFATHFPAPIILGLEEQLDGTLLEFLNNEGLITLGFEGGQHDSPEAIMNHRAVIRIALVSAGLMSEKDAPWYADARARVANVTGGLKVIEVRYRHAIRPGDNFQMKPGFENFDPIKKGDVLADDWRGEVKAPEAGMVLLPLYQKLGDDGFFVARRVKSHWFRLSAYLRSGRLHRLLPLLPGVRRHMEDSEVLVVNTKVARVLPLQVFHLLGYRKLRWVDEFLVVSRRKFDVRGPRRYRLTVV